MGIGLADMKIQATYVHVDIRLYVTTEVGCVLWLAQQNDLYNMFR